VRALDRKLVRDLLHLRGQVLAIALVVACGVATVVTTRTAYESLVLSRDAYYSRHRFADVFVRLTRAPDALRARLEAIPGVARVETRIVEEVTLDVPGLAEPATGRLVSLPERRPPALNDVYLRRGRRIEPGRRDEVLASEAFADANRLDVGDTIGAVVNGRWERLRIVGVALSPEYVYEIRGTEVFPDNRRFGVLWMSRDALGPAFQMEGAFNDVALGLAPGAIEAEVVARLDRLLERYGGLGAYGRRDQVSHRFLADEIAQNRVSGTVLPAIFLGVAAFLLNLVLARVVAMQRDQIAVLKAFGYPDRTIALHYLAFALVATALGAAAGTGLGLWLGAVVNRAYVQFYRFPVLRYAPGSSVVALAVGASAAAALLGAFGGVRRALALPPAEAMRPEPPAAFHAGWLERLALSRLFRSPGRMILRGVARRPVRAGLSVLGVAFALAIVVVGRYLVDAVALLTDVQFRAVQREDVTVAFREPLPARARHDVAALPGVLRAEPYRVVAARVRLGHRTRRVALLGLERAGELRRLVGADLAPEPVPPAGVVLTARLARILGATPGDAITVEVLEGKRQVREVRVAGLVDELVGLSAYMDRRALNALLGEGATVSGAFLRVDARAAPRLYAALKRMPAVAGSTSRLASLRSFRETFARSLGIFTLVLVAFASVVATAMVYNAARIALSERARDLASLRVLGFTRGEVAGMLLGEQALITGLAVPAGFAVGWAVCRLVAGAYQWELFRLPLVVRPASYAFALGVVGGAAILSGLVVRRRLDRLDLVEVLKARE
jgi:putative ABC transport system permease protein